MSDATTMTDAEIGREAIHLAARYLREEIRFPRSLNTSQGLEAFKTLTEVHGCDPEQQVFDMVTAGEHFHNEMYNSPDNKSDDELKNARTLTARVDFLLAIIAFLAEAAEAHFDTYDPES